MMKRILCKLFVVALAAGFMNVMSVSAQSQDTDYKALLQELMEASGSLKSVQQMIPQMLAPLKEQMPELTEESIGKLQSLLEDRLVNRMVDLYVPIYQKSLTADDLKQIVAFYKSPVGKKWGEATADITVDGAKGGLEIGKSLQDEVKAVLEEAAAR